MTTNKDMQALTLYDLSALFFMLLIGLSLSVCALTAERHFTKRGRKKSIYSPETASDIEIQELETTWQLVNTISGDTIDVSTADLVHFFAHLNKPSLNAESD